MGFNLSTNMNLPVPAVGSEAGPQYALDINNCMTLIDQHDHSPGYGVQINPTGLNINSDLSFNNNNLVSPRSVRLQVQPSTISGPSDLDCLYASGVDLYYNDGAGNQVRITQSGGVAGTPGSIANLTSPASASYSAGSSTFIWQSAASTPANMDAASYVLRNLSSGSFGLTLNPPAAMAADYAITLPSLPASTLPVSISTSGAMSAAPITLAQLAASVLASLVPPGAFTGYGGTAAPTGWLMCDGTSYLRADYPALFSAIGTAYGAADGTHFNVPDFRGRFIRGTDNGAGRDPDAASRTAMNPGGNTGDNVGSIQSFAFQDHVHGVQVQSLGSNAGGAGASNGAGTTGGAQTGNASTETRPLNANGNFIIKT